MTTDQRNDGDYGLEQAFRSSDPYPAYARIREEAPTHFSPFVQGWIISRYVDVAAAFRHPGLSANRMGAYARVLPAPLLAKVEPLIRNLSSWILMMDPPAQSRIRTLIAGAFTPRFVEGMRARTEAIVDELIDAAAAGEGEGEGEGEGHGHGFDLIRAIAYPLPVRVIGDMLGLPPADHDRLKVWSDALATFLGIAAMDPAIVAKAVRSVVEMEAYFNQIIAERRREPGEDLISLMVAAHDDEGRLSDQELVSSCCMILFGGHETTTNLIGNGVYLLLKHPQQAAKLRADPSLIDTAVEEILRYEAPVQRMGRLSAADVELSGTTIPAGQRVYLMMAAANRDGAEFTDADTFDITRKGSRHLSLGVGIHYCLGAALGRMEGKLAIAALLRRFPALALDPAQPPKWLDNITIRGFEHLHVRTGEAAS